MPIIVKFRSRRSTPINRRDTEALNALERLRLRVIASNLDVICSILPSIRNHRQARTIAMELLIAEYTEMLSILIVETPDRPPRMVYLPMTFNAMEDHLIHIGVTVSQRFRFQSFDALRRILRTFQLPEGYITLDQRYKSTAEEILLISLSRLTFPLR
jgi:hypothetical protein